MLFASTQMRCYENSYEDLIKCVHWCAEWQDGPSRRFRRIIGEYKTSMASYKWDITPVR